MIASLSLASRADAQTSSAEYRVTFISTWSASTHPANFPSNPHFSGLIGATHNASASFWQEGGLASPGIKSMAETGSKGLLQGEIESAIQAGTVNTLLSQGGLSTSPGSRTFTFHMSAEFPLVTLVSMLAPSPDWFVGVTSLSLYEDQQWVSEKVIDLFVYDAGTDSGTNYTSPNQATNPAHPISKIQGIPFLVDSEVLHVGTYTFQREDATTVKHDERNGSQQTLGSVFPNPFSHEATLKLSIPDGQHVSIGVFNLLGRKVLDLYDGLLQSGVDHAFTINGRQLPEGLYLYRISAENFQRSGKLTILR